MKESGTVDEFYKYPGKKLPEVGEVIKVVRFLRDRPTRARVTDVDARDPPRTEPSRSVSSADGWLARSGARRLVAGARFGCRLLTLPVAPTRPIPITSGMAAPVASCRLAPFPCHAEGRRFEPVHPLHRTRWKQRVFLWPEKRSDTMRRGIVRKWSGSRLDLGAARQIIDRLAPLRLALCPCRSPRARQDQMFASPHVTRRLRSYRRTPPPELRLPRRGW